MKTLLRWLVALTVIAVAVIGGLIAFGTSSASPSNSTVAGFRGMDYTTLPALEHYVARDGVVLGYRRYGPSAAPPAPARVLVLIHGVSDSGLSLHLLGESLQAAAVQTYVPELRGHGSSSPRGDIRYVGQLDDDLVDLVAVLRRRENHAPLQLAGFSAGGGFALRFASGPHAALFDRYLLLAPALAYQGPTVRPPAKNATGVRSFSVPYVPRLIGLAAADAVGIHAFDGLPVIAFAVPPDSRVLTQTYTLRMLNNLMPADFLHSFAGIKQPTTVLIGDADEFSIANEVVRAIHGPRPDIPVRVLSGISHLGLVTDPNAMAVVVAWAKAE